MNSSPLKILLVSGGTGGHIYPAIAIAEHLKSLGHHPVIITDHRVKDIANKTNIEHIPLTLYHPSGSIAQKLKSATSLTIAYFKSKKIYTKHQPSLVIGFGGYPTLPTLLAAQAMHIPTILHEQNAVLGKTNRFLAKRAKAIATSFETTNTLDTQTTCPLVRTGNLIRKKFIDLRDSTYAPPQANQPCNILIIGGSQGAQIFGEIIPNALNLLPDHLIKRLNIVQQTRPEQLEFTKTRYLQCQIKAEISAFFDNIAEKMLSAHLIIARSGASSLTEISIIGRPSILIPYKFATDDHQLMNAKALEQKNGAIVIEQKDLRIESFATLIQSLIENPVKLSSLAKNSHSFSEPKALEKITNLIFKYAISQPRSEAKS
jgi:UDP-N-acetylglucosamine--N-acetylmuramyl-(pentapeptide) pyrophosphoryl-undecaprenol N-acetylglucosamine transferase